MSFKKYSEYKYSGVAWLGMIPAHWEVKPLKQVITKIESGTSVNAVDVPATQAELGVLKTSCVYKGWFDWKENKTVVNEEYERVTCPLKRNTLIVSRMNTPELVGAAGLVTDAPANIYLPDRLWQIHFGTAEPSFIHYWTHSPYYRAQVKSACSGTSSSMQNLSQDQFRTFILTLPPVVEQQAIATFLDRETAKIDALVAEQQRLIDLLFEKRQTVIANVVTMGLDPTVPMKDSGVEGLTKVPAHWDVAPLKRHWRVTDCKHLTADFVDEGIPVASIREVQSKWVNLENAKQTTEHFYNLLIEGGRRPEPGDLIFSRNATVGEVAQVADTHPPFALGQDVVLLRKVDPEVCSDFLQNVLQSEVVVRQLNQLMIGSTFKRINVEEIRSLIIPFPPSHEQGEISRYLEARAAEFDNLIQAANEAVTLLLERRAALISAAVTGKIDVSGAIVLEAV